MSISASHPYSPLLGNHGLQDTQDTKREWQTLFQAPVGEDDQIWKDYLEKAAAIDIRMIDDWNKVIDVVLVYVSVDPFTR